jgi:hypothetical protein
VVEVPQTLGTSDKRKSKIMCDTCVEEPLRFHVVLWRRCTFSPTCLMHRVVPVFHFGPSFGAEWPRRHDYRLLPAYSSVRNNW